MGVSTCCSVGFFTKEKEQIKKITLEGIADKFIYDIINDGGATFNPDSIAEFSAEEKEILKIYFDEESVSVLEGYAKVTPNIQNPNELKTVWKKIRRSTIIEFEKSMIAYHKKLSADPSVKMSEDDFERKLFNYRCTLECVSEIISMLNLAIEDGTLVEITAVDG